MQRLNPAFANAMSFVLLYPAPPPTGAVVSQILLVPLSVDHMRFSHKLRLNFAGRVWQPS